MSTPSPSADRNLIFGLLALQMDFVTREQLLDAMNAWMIAKQSPLSEILCRRGVLAEDDRTDLDRLVGKHIKRHGDDPQASLAALRVTPAVRRDLDRLGDADVQASVASLAPTPADHVAAENSVVSPATSVPIVAVVGGARFRRLREHAKGGLGEVFVALDQELNREVALKEIQDRFADQPNSRARFLREAEITGNLEHPGIVPVYGLGAYPDGRPYYAMRFIRGESMQEAITRFHQADNHPRRGPGERSLALRDLLSRFVAVCNAIAYAHSRGVIHRDLKPANAMLGEYGETLVVDWGLARLIDQTDGQQTTAERPVAAASADSGTAPTEMGQVVGTPAFMPPEQAEGRHDLVGPASDVFALGATLYALLTGQPPYHGDNVLAQARRAEAAPARQHKRSVPAALEAVCGKAMAAKPNSRYATARLLAEDVQRFLADEPVQAYREPLSDRLRRWGRRNRSLVTAGVVLLLAGVVSLSVGLWAVQREKARTENALSDARENLKRAEKAETDARQNLTQADDNLKLARRAIDECFNVAKDHPLFQERRMHKAKKLLLEKTMPFYKNFRSQRPNDQRLQHEEAAQWFRLGYSERALDQTTEAMKSYKQARALFVQLIKVHSEATEYQHDLAVTVHNLAMLLSDLGQRPEALQEFQQPLAVFGKLVRAHPEVPEYQHALGSTLDSLGNLLSEMGKRQEALKEYEKARTVRGNLAGDHPEMPLYQHDLASTFHNLGNLLSEMGKHQEALKEYEKALAVFGKLTHAHPEVPDYSRSLALAHHHLGKLLAALDRREEALKEYQQARDVLVQLVRSYPEVSVYTEELGRTCVLRGSLLATMKQMSAALADLNEAITRAESLSRLDARNPNAKPFLLAGLAQRAEVLAGLGEHRAAVADWDRLEKLAPAAHRFAIRMQRADSLARLGDYPRAAGEVDDLAGGWFLSGAMLYNLACIHALDAGSAARDASRPLPERTKRAEEYACSAVKLLQRAEALTYFRDPAKLSELDKDADFAFLRERDDFKRFRAGLKPAK